MEKAQVLHRSRIENSDEPKENQWGKVSDWESLGAGGSSRRGKTMTPRWNPWVKWDTRLQRTRPIKVLDKRQDKLNTNLIGGSKQPLLRSGLHIGAMGWGGLRWGRQTGIHSNCLCSVCYWTLREEAAELSAQVSCSGSAGLFEGRKLFSLLHSTRKNKKHGLAVHKALHNAVALLVAGCSWTPQRPKHPPIPNHLQCAWTHARKNIGWALNERLIQRVRGGQ